MVYFWGCVWDVPWLTVWLWPYFHHALACVCTVPSTRSPGFLPVGWGSALHIAQLYVAGSHLYFLITFDAKLNGMFDWFAGDWSASNTSRYWKSISSSIPSPVYFSWVYIFIIKQFELGSQTRDQSDHLALAFFLVYKLTFFCVKIVST